MAVIKQTKVKINATINRTIYNKAVAYAGENFSNFVETCIAYYIGALDKEKELKQKEAEEAVKLKQAEDIDLAATLIKLLKNHPELLSEVSGKRNHKRNHNNNNDCDDYETEEILD